MFVLWLVPGLCYPVYIGMTAGFEHFSTFLRPKNHWYAWIHRGNILYRGYIENELAKSVNLNPRFGAPNNFFCIRNREDLTKMGIQCGYIITYYMVFGCVRKKGMIPQFMAIYGNLWQFMGDSYDTPSEFWGKLSQDKAFLFFLLILG